MRINAEDRIGCKFGKLTIVEILNNRDKKGNKMCRAVCDCGNSGEWTLTWITSGNTSSCGCAPKKKQITDSQGLYRKYDGYKRDAKRRGYSFNLSYDEFVEIGQSNCHYCSLTAQTKEYVRKGIIIESYIFNGIDRIDNNCGYEIDNVVPCCSFCNQAKHTNSYNDFKSWINRLVLSNG